MYDAGIDNIVLYSEKEIYCNYLRTKNKPDDLLLIVITLFCLFFMIFCCLVGILFLTLFL